MIVKKVQFRLQKFEIKMKILIVQETRRHEIYTTGHGKASPFQPWWSVRGEIPAFNVNRCSLPGSMFCFCLLRLGLAVTGSSGWKLRNADTRCGYLSIKMMNDSAVHVANIKECGHVACVDITSANPSLSPSLSFSSLVGHMYLSSSTSAQLTRKCCKGSLS